MTLANVFAILFYMTAGAVVWELVRYLFRLVTGRLDQGAAPQVRLEQFTNVLKGERLGIIVWYAAWSWFTYQLLKYWLPQKLVLRDLTQPLHEHLFGVTIASALGMAAATLAVVLIDRGGELRKKMPNGVLLFSYIVAITGQVIFLTRVPHHKTLVDLFANPYGWLTQIAASGIAGIILAVTVIFLVRTLAKAKVSRQTRQATTGRSTPPGEPSPAS